MNLGGLLTVTHELIFSPENLPQASAYSVGRASRIFEGVPVLNNAQQQQLSAPPLTNSTARQGGYSAVNINNL